MVHYKYLHKGHRTTTQNRSQHNSVHKQNRDREPITTHTDRTSHKPRRQQQPKHTDSQQPNLHTRRLGHKNTQEPAAHTHKNQQHARTRTNTNTRTSHSGATEPHTHQFRYFFFFPLWCRSRGFRVCFFGTFSVKNRIRKEGDIGKEFFLRIRGLLFSGAAAPPSWVGGPPRQRRILGSRWRTRLCSWEENREEF